MLLFFARFLPRNGYCRKFLAETLFPGGGSCLFPFSIFHISLLIKNLVQERDPVVASRNPQTSANGRFRQLVSHEEGTTKGMKGMEACWNYRCHEVFARDSTAYFSSSILVSFLFLRSHRLFASLVRSLARFLPARLEPCVPSFKTQTPLASACRSVRVPSLHVVAVSLSQCLSPLPLSSGKEGRWQPSSPATESTNRTSHTPRCTSRIAPLQPCKSTEHYAVNNEAVSAGPPACCPAV